MKTLTLAFLTIALTGTIHANDLPDAPTPKAFQEAPKHPTNDGEKFWDRSMKIEYIAGIGLAGFDTGATCWELNNGGKEYNLPIHTCKQMAAWTFGFHAAGLGAAYLLHRMHHDKLALLPEAYLGLENAYGGIYSTTHKR